MVAGHCGVGELEGENEVKMRTGFKIKGGNSSRIWGGGKESNISEGYKASKQIDAK